jgi:hypothetical protein
MSTQYSGTFTVVNCTGNTITGVTVTHDGYVHNTATAKSLEPGASVSQVLNAQTGTSDDWTLSFTMNNKVYSRNAKRCDYETTDAPQTCIVALYLANFSIVMPVSSSCEHNYYSTPTEVAGDLSKEYQKPAKAS